MLRFGEGRPWRRRLARESEGDMASGRSCPRLDGEAGKGKKKGDGLGRRPQFARFYVFRT